MAGGFTMMCMCFFLGASEKTSDNVSIGDNGPSLTPWTSLIFSGRLWTSWMETLQRTRVLASTCWNRRWFSSLMHFLRVPTDLFAAISTGKMRSEGSPRTQQFSSRIVSAVDMIEGAERTHAIRPSGKGTHVIFQHVFQRVSFTEANRCINYIMSNKSPWPI